MRAKVIRKGLIIDGEEQEVGTVIDVSEGLCKRSVKLETVGKPVVKAMPKKTSTKTGTK